jgi:hypothetical protein
MQNNNFLATLYMFIGGAVLVISLGPWIVNLLFIGLGFWLLNRGMVMRGMPGIFLVVSRWVNERNRYY